MLKTSKNKKLIYSFDIDGVVVNTAGNAIKLFNKKFNKHKKVTDLKSFFIINDWIFDILKDKDLAQTETVKVWNDDKVLAEAKPVDGALKLIKSFYDERFDVHFITSRPNSTREVTLRWFKKWMPWVRYSDIHMSPNTGSLQRSFKVETIKSVNPDIHFEDSIEHAQDIAGVLPTAKVILVRQPWNYDISTILPASIVVPKGDLINRNLKASYDYYLRNQ